ncbi:hypothetical protein [Eisenibacter elegans]|jgi:hypothetical protein|uniref:hypothetical protein n=1 Tax=Eisenibacter elegans TaxID=997 RepID=UPI000421C460|nr:hypothetical protein [Eisenibacter elegans]
MKNLKDRLYQHISFLTARDDTYKNVLAYYGVTSTKRIVIGAHYDVDGEREGADIMPVL